MKQLAGQNGLPVFVYLWVWATARVTHPVDSRMLCLPCTLTVGRGLAPAESQHSVHIDNWLHP